jgi:hypothetical protein
LKVAWVVVTGFPCDSQGTGNPSKFRTKWNWSDKAFDPVSNKKSLLTQDLPSRFTAMKQALIQSGKLPTLGRVKCWRKKPTALCKLF